LFTGYDGIFFVCAKKSTVYFVNFLIFGEISAYYSEMGVFIVFLRNLIWENKKCRLEKNQSAFALL